MSKNLIDISVKQADQLVQQAQYTRQLLNKMVEHEEKMLTHDKKMDEQWKETLDIKAEVIEIKNSASNRLDKLENNLAITHGEGKFIKAKVAEKSYQLVNEFLGTAVSNELYHKKRCHFITGLYSRLNKHFNSITYTTIKHIDFEKAMCLIEDTTLEDLPRNYLKLTDNQIETAKRHGDYAILEKLNQFQI
ncbi:hypothetical protein C7J88_09480 [Staphylococcus muscae]|uniref:Phage protein n=1 Tax=Staphylococcus muscae TaxID=1294 RepID=A0A240BYF7_9STAP|nr:ORF6C domain-containing protein [Staphylococcus muscae]AVQ34381.1 hypothetical protein C7J88_09480 [Staphylococcus muscae]PNZ02523.1 hypothetical protein CD131_08175 [Staphylococcus muscae]GGA93536.1 hypothetical protein GCM10007183_17200 [Staphylococcus muscae]SNW00529.1 phage protein [Staphylococcus muscae]